MIELRAVTKRFGDTTALDRVSLSVGPGEIVAVLGPNGSGKTTLLKCAAGLIRATSGRVLVDGADPIERDTRRKLSYLPQRIVFPEALTAEEVLKFYGGLRQLTPESIHKGLQRCALNGFGSRPIRTYSGGMLQRLGVAVALLPDAMLLLLDEPTVGLDAEVCSLLRSSLENFRDQGKTILLSTHTVSDAAAIADRAAILISGSLVAVEPIAVLRERFAGSTTMRVRVRDAGVRFGQIVRATGADCIASENELFVRSAELLRMPILRALETAGATIISLSTQEPSLEEVYMRCLHESSIPAVNSSADHN